MRGQSAEARRERLKNGCCPVHGIGMARVYGWPGSDQGRLLAGWHNDAVIDGRVRNKRRQFLYVECPRRDCSITAKAWPLAPEHCGPFDPMPCTLTREYAHLTRRTKGRPST